MEDDPVAERNKYAENTESAPAVHDVALAEPSLHVTVTNALSGAPVFAGEFASKQAFAEHLEMHFPGRFQDVWFLQEGQPLSRNLETLLLPQTLPLPPVVSVTLGMVKGPRKDLQLRVVANNEAQTLLLSGLALPHLHMSDIVQAIGRIIVDTTGMTVVAQQAMTDKELMGQWQRTALGQDPREAQVMTLWYVASNNVEQGPLAISLREIWEDALIAGHVRLRAHLEVMQVNFADPVGPVDPVDSLEPTPLRLPLLRCRNGRFDDFFRYA